MSEKILRFEDMQSAELSVYEDPGLLLVSVGVDDGDDGASLLLWPDEADELANALKATAAEVRKRREGK